jgi:hypothetical protein
VRVLSSNTSPAPPCRARAASPPAMRRRSPAPAATARLKTGSLLAILLASAVGICLPVALTRAFRGRAGPAPRQVLRRGGHPLHLARPRSPRRARRLRRHPRRRAARAPRRPLGVIPPRGPRPRRRRRGPARLRTRPQEVGARLRARRRNEPQETRVLGRP